jgi:hypothetical protein
VTAQVASTDDALDEDLVRLPAGEVHGWFRGQNETVCGLSLSKSRLQAVCPRCRAGIEGRTSKRRTWTRERPRP